MNSRKHTLLLRSAAFLWAFSFGVHSMTVAQCPISLVVSHTDAQQLSLADIDFEHFQSNSLLYTLSFRNDASDSATAQLDLTVRLEVADGSLNESIHGRSSSFEIPPGGRTVTNLNVGSTGDIRFPDFVIPEDVKSKLQDASLASGLLPAGRYTFNFELVNATCGTVTTSPVVIVIQNPSRVELRSPGDGGTTNEFPLFEYFLDNNLRATLTVAEKNPDQSREEAILRQPPMLQADLAGQNAFPYSGGRPLEEGKTYVWQVVGKIRGTGGRDTEVPSPIWLFTVSSSNQVAGTDPLLNLLEEMLGQRYPSIFKQIRDGGYVLTGRFELINSPLTRSELLDLLNRLRENSDGIELSFE